MIYPLNATSQSVDVQIVDDTGLPVTALVAATFPTLTYSLAGANADVAFPALSDLALITTAWAAGGVKERGNGVYRLDLPNGVFTAAGEVKVRGEASGKHVLAPWIDVGPIPTDLQTVKGQAVTCAAPVTVLASVGTAATSTAQSGDSFARLGAPAGASIAADLAEIEGETDALLAGVTVGGYAAGQDPATLVLAGSIETGVSLKQAIQRIGATTAGKLSGAQSGNPATEVFVGLDGVTTRVTVTADSSGNRTAVVYS